MKKHTFKFVKQYFEDRDCELYETEYKNDSTLMRYRCDCGNDECKIRFNNFRNGQRCRKCSGCEKLTYKEVKKYFEDHGCELMETEYINNQTLMRYRCDCGNDECKICFNNFKQGQRCRKCSGCEKFTFDYVYSYFKEHKCLLLETEYKDNRTKMRYKCICGNDECSINFYNFRQGQRCKKCGYKKIGDKKRFTYKEVKQYFKDHNCELFETKYKNCDTLMRYRCDCGNDECSITFYRFKKGGRCKKCGIEKISGENSYMYNLNLTDEEREKGRICHGYKKWVKDIYKQDNFTCQCCFEIGGKLIAHHIESYGDNEELRIVLSNGITFCEGHHIEFHKEYGYGNNNREQLEEFLNTFNLKVH